MQTGKLVLNNAVDDIEFDITAERQQSGYIVTLGYVGGGEIDYLEAYDGQNTSGTKFPTAWGNLNVTSGYLTITTTSYYFCYLRPGSNITGSIHVYSSVPVGDGYETITYSIGSNGKITQNTDSNE